MIKNLKQNWKVFLFSFIYGIVTYSLYFQAHYVHDSYRIYNFGFLQNLNGFWTQGRPVCMCFNILFNFLNITPRISQIISMFFIFLFLSLSSVVIYSLIIKRTLNERLTDLKIKIIILLITNGLFFNVYITDWMMFFEGCVFALGCFLAVISAYYTVEMKESYKKYVISSIFLIIAIFCYQASIAIGGAIIILLTIYDNKDKKILSIIKMTIINMLPYVFALLLNFVFIKLVNLNNTADARLSGNVDILYNLLFVIKQIRWYFINMFGYPTKYIVALLIFITFIFYTVKLIKKKNNKITLLYTIVSLFSLWLLSILPILAMPSDSIYFISRSIPYIASIFPFMLLAIYLFNNDLFNSDKKTYYILLIIYTLIVTVSVLKVTSECLKNNLQDINIAKNIQNEIDKYENSTNNTIDTIILLPDTKISLNEKNITYYSDNTVRAFSSYYGAKEIMYFASKRYYNVTDGTNAQKEELFGDKEWNSFDLEQLKFDRNILYLVKY